MIQRAVTAIIGVVIGLFATFAVFSAILGGLDSFYLLTRDACNYGTENSPKRALRVAPENLDHPGDADKIDWTADGMDLVHDGAGGCGVDGVVVGGAHLTPTGDPVDLSVEVSSGALSTMTLTVSNRFLPGLIHLEGDLLWYASGRTKLGTYSISRGATLSAPSFSLHSNNEDARAVAVVGSYFYVYDLDDDTIYVYNRDTGNRDSGRTISLHSDNAHGNDMFVTDTHLYVSDSGTGEPVYAYRLSDGSYDPSRNLPVGTRESVYGIDHDGRHTYYLVTDPGSNIIHITPGLTSVANARSAGTLLSKPLQTGPNYFGLEVSNRGMVYIGTTIRTTLHAGDLEISGGGYSWIEAENVFTAQQQLVTLLAVIAAIGMPIGAMTAIVFFGQAVISSGVSGQGASQVLVAIAAVVVILVAVQMFQQFAGYLGNAFDAVDGDRFVVFDETLGSLAETIAEFWGVLAFAGLINIATIVWRNYSGNFSIGGGQGGL